MQYQINEPFSDSTIKVFLIPSFTWEADETSQSEDIISWYDDELLAQQERFMYQDSNIIDEFQLLVSPLPENYTPQTISPKRMLETFTAVTSRVALNDNLESALAMLEELNQSLSLSLAIFSDDTVYSDSYLKENSLTELIHRLREAEQSAISNDKAILHKALAQTRSLAVRSQRMIDQRLTIPATFKGRASAESLKALADMATQRLHSMAE